MQEILIVFKYEEGYLGNKKTIQYFGNICFSNYAKNSICTFLLEVSKEIWDTFSSPQEFPRL